MYGPGPDPRQVLAPVLVYDDPWSHLICVGLGLGISALALWRRPPEALRYLALIVGQVIFLTAPLLWHLDRYVYGAFPTIDKEGSLLFYLDGVHLRMLAHPLLSPADPAARLIGVHVGHLWVTQFFDLFLSPVGAFNAQGLLYLVLGWWCAWLLLREVCSEPRVAFLLGFPFGMGLHVFRDLNWYTIEKAAIFWLPLYMWAVHRAWKRGGRWRYLPGLVFLGMAWTNLYLALVAGVFVALAVAWMAAEVVRSRGTIHPGFRRVLHAASVSALALAPLALWQWALMQGGPQLGTPEQFLWERAALDGFSLAPLRWNRLELHRALNMVAVGLAVFGAVRLRHDRRVQFATAAGFILLALAIGPVLLPGPVMNPVYMLAREVIPGFWRVAKPEVFFHATWMLMLCVAAVELVSFTTSRRGVGILYGLFVLAWLAMVRSHPAYPPMTMPIESRLSPNWAEGVFQSP